MAELSFILNGASVTVDDGGGSLLEVLRDRLGVRSAKDGCSPQGQCGCCTVLVDGQARVACVTPAVRVTGRSVTTLEGLDPAVSQRWSSALCASGGTQCGYCTPGIVVRLAAAEAKAPLTAAGVEQALLAHLCRCTGWQTITEAALTPQPLDPARDLVAAARRAAIEGGSPQSVGPQVAWGEAGFADDTAPLGALVAVRAGDGSWIVEESLTAARRASGKIQGRRTTAAVSWPIDLPPGEWARTVQTTWVEPAYLEPDAAWCDPGGEPAAALANGGAFGGKLATEVRAVARRLADEQGRTVRVSYSREDVVTLGPKRPPVAVAVRADGTGIARVARAAGIADAIRSVAPGLEVEEIDVPGPPVSAALRAAGWAEAVVLLSSLGPAPDTITAPNGAVASAAIADDGTVTVTVDAGEVLDETVLRSYCIGAAHMALGWVRSEAIAVDDEGVPQDLTVRSFGVLRAVDTPHIDVHITPSSEPPRNGSDAVFAAVAAAAWRALGHPARWPATR